MVVAATCWAVVPAAGSGTRFRADADELPKQYQLLAGKPVLVHTLKQLLAIERLRGITVALSAEDNYYASMVKATLSSDEQQHLSAVVGGASRAESVLHGLRALGDKAQADDWVLVHDAARPLLQLSDVNRLIDCCGDTDCGGVLVSPLHDTVKESVAEQSPSSPFVEAKQTHSRERMWLAQTPQMFRYAPLLAALESEVMTASAAGRTIVNEAITDEAMAMERAGHSVLLVPGSNRNMKITTREDLALAQYYLQCDASLRDGV